MVARPQDRPERIVPSERQLSLRTVFVRHYVEDIEFRNDLVRLASNDNFYVPKEPWNLQIWRANLTIYTNDDGIASYDSKILAIKILNWIYAVNEFCDRWGLTFSDDGAQSMVHGWARLRRYHRNHLDPDWITACLHAPSVFPSGEIEPPPATGWNPTRESRKAARKRILNAWAEHLDAELTRIASAFECLPKRPKSRRHAARDIKWLFWRQRHRWTYEEIAQREMGYYGTNSHQEINDSPDIDVDAVRKACRRMAALAGVRLYCGS